MRARVAPLATLFALLAALLAPPAFAAELLSTTPPALKPSVGSRAIPPDEAFALQTILEANGDILFLWDMPPAYYLYRKSLKLAHAGKDLLPQLDLPEGTTVTDEFFGESEVYFTRLMARLPAAALQAAPGATVEFELAYQGCFENVYCYPPQQRTVSVTLP